MSSIAFTKGLHGLGNGHFAYLQPKGTWGYSNAGLVIDGDESLLVDTLFDEVLTAEMLRAIKSATGVGAGAIKTLVNTHANGDHTFGNSLIENATIIASASGAREMERSDNAELLCSIMKNSAEMGDLGAYFQAIFGGFDFAGVRLRLPDRTFSGQEIIRVGDKDVHLIEVGPAHTAGDTLVHIPKDKVIYTGDILFIEGTPIMWSGPVRNWLAACDRMLAMDVDHIVPGHGPVTTKEGIRPVAAYLSYVEEETRKRHAAGMDSWEAAQDIALGEFGAWEDPERIAVTVDTIYREINRDRSQRRTLDLFEKMSQLDRRYHPERTAARPR